jgi:hypothetical protein
MKAYLARLCSSLKNHPEASANHQQLMQLIYIWFWALAVIKIKLSRIKETHTVKGIVWVKEFSTWGTIKLPLMILSLSLTVTATYIMQLCFIISRPISSPVLIKHHYVECQVRSNAKRKTCVTFESSQN